MTYTPRRHQLQGLSVETAELYGKPHLGAEYIGSSVKNYCLTSEECAICRRKATNAHHVPPRSKGSTFHFQSCIGSCILRPALFALCGSGTTGCHNGFHGKARYKPFWRWDSDEWAEAWWNGDLLKDYAPHDPGLYLYGCWLIRDLVTGETFTRVETSDGIQRGMA